MKYFLIALLCFICVAKTYGQTVTNSFGQIVVEITKEKKSKKVYAKLEIKSAFPGGDSSWVQSIEKSIVQSISVRKGIKKGKYIVSVVYIINKDGSLSDVHCLNNPDIRICEEVLREIKKSRRSEKWIPAPQPIKNISG